jgi:hypothetical protein
MVETMNRLKRVFILVGISGGALFLLVAVVGFVLLRYLNSGLERRITAIRAAGDPVLLRDFARPAIAPEQNAATFLGRAQDDVNAIHKELAPVYDRSSYQKSKLTADDRKAIRTALDAHPQAIRLLEEAAACRDFNDQRYYTRNPQALSAGLLPDQASIGTVALVLQAHASLLASEGDVQGAVHSCVLLLCILRLYEHEPPMLINCMTTTACRGVAVGSANVALRSGPVPDAAQKELEQELTLDNGLNGYQQALKTGRALFIQNFDTMSDFPSWASSLASMDQCALLDFFSEQLTLADRPYAEAVRSPTGKPQGFALRPVSRSMMPAVMRIREAIDRVRAQMRCLRILNVLQGRRLSAPVQLKLADLGLPGEVITDPYNGEPLHLKKLPEGWLIYAVGENLLDDGGDLENRKDVGLGPIPR